VKKWVNVLNVVKIYNMIIMDFHTALVVVWTYMIEFKEKMEVLNAKERK